MRHLPCLLLALMAALGCKHQEVYPALGLNVASPVDVASSTDNNYFFVLNADFDRTYNVGSLMTLDKDGNKLNALEVPRMGRSLTVAGNYIIATIDYQDDTGDNPPRAEIYDVSDAKNPVMVADIILDSTPVNAAMVAGYQYFAISCLDGSLWVGQLGTNPYNTHVYKVRQFGVMRRAMYIDAKNEMLYLFTTDPDREYLGDEELEDVMTYNQTYATPIYPTTDPNGTLGVPNPNDVPDEWENNVRELADTTQREYYEYVAFDFHQESGDADATNHSAPNCPPNTSCKFPYRSGTDPVLAAELRFVYFDLKNADGSPDRSAYFNNPDYKFYRTNFFAARPDTDDPNVFYLSQRGSPDKSQFANSIVKVTMIGDPHSTPPVAGLGNWTPPIPNSSIMQFERVYGFKGPEANPYVYTGDFQVKSVDGQKIVVINNFRDLVNWVQADRYFSIAGQTLDNNQSWYNEISGNLDPTQPQGLETYYQIALMPDGRAASCSFYGNAVILLDITPGVDITKVNRVE